MEIDRILECLQDMRNNIIKIKVKEDSTKSAKELLYWLSGSEVWTDRQCVSFYESILREYIKDDIEALELMLTVSGLMDGYRNPSWSASDRREAYLASLEAKNSDSDKTAVGRNSRQRYKVVTTTSALEKREKKQFKTIATLLKRDYDDGKITRLIINRWTTAAEIPDDMETPNHWLSALGTKKKAHAPKPKNTLNKNKIIKVLHKHKTVINIEDIRFNFQPRITLVFVAIALVVVLLGYSWINRTEQSNEPEPQPTASPIAFPIKDILIPDEDVVITSGEVFQLEYAVFPREADVSTLSFVSLDPEVLTVSQTGEITAYAGQPGEKQRTTEVIIQSENGKTKHIPVTVNFSDVTDYDLISDINNFEAEYIVEQELRLVGETEWKKEIDAQIGDKIEFLICYKNTSDKVQRNVMIKDILPKNMRYISNSTTLFNGVFPNGGLMTDDNITTTGVNIGNYGPNTTVYVRFTAEVVDNTLQHGRNMLGNWSQCGVWPVTLQDYTLVYINKDR